MGRLALAMTLGLFALPALGAADGYDRALEILRPKLATAAFSAARLSAPSHLTLQATRLFVSSGTARQRGWVGAALSDWREALRDAGIKDPEPLAAVLWKGGGGLWTLEAGKPVRIEDWSDDRPPLAGEQGRSGRLFGFLGGQMVRGADADATGFNARLGSTMLQDRYDLAASFGYAALESVTTRTYGLVGRALFPVAPGLGWNAGVQLSRFDPSRGDVTNTVSVLAGLNFFLPGGSFDVTLQVGSRSTYGVLAGYTFFLTRN